MSAARVVENLTATVFPAKGEALQFATMGTSGLDADRVLLVGKVQRDDRKTLFADIEVAFPLPDDAALDSSVVAAVRDALDARAVPPPR
jgi:hypothetical protein